MKKIVYLTICAFAIGLISFSLSSCRKDKSHFITYTPDSLVFHGNDTLQLHLSTHLIEGCTFSLYPPYWIETDTWWGEIGFMQDYVVTLISHMDTILFAPTDQNTLVEIYASNGSNNEYRCAVPLKGIPMNHAQYSIPDTLFFPAGHDNMPLQFRNTGNTPIAYSIHPSNTFVSTTPASGEIPVGEESNIIVHIDRESLFSPSNPTLMVTINGDEIPVCLVVEHKQMIEADVIDAEYCKASDLMVYVTSAVTLDIYHPDTKTTDHIPLSYYPNCVSVSMDGTKAVVGHDAHVSYVDLITKSVINTFDVSCNAKDIVMGDNGWAYVFPKQSQWQKIRCIELDNPNAMETLHSGNLIYAGTKAKMQPTGKYIYGAVNGVSSMNLEKYDIQMSTAMYLAEQDPPSNYRPNGDLWFSEDGSRIFGKSGYVFKATEDENTDMTYNGTLQTESFTNYQKVLWIEHSASLNDIFILCNTDYDGYNSVYVPTPFVFINDAESLLYKDKIRLENYLILNANGTVSQCSPCPHFVFANASNGEIYVIVKAFDSNIQQSWAIQTLQLD